MPSNSSWSFTGLLQALPTAIALGLEKSLVVAHFLLLFFLNKILYLEQTTCSPAWVYIRADSSVSRGSWIKYWRQSLSQRHLVIYCTAFTLERLILISGNPTILGILNSSVEDYKMQLLTGNVRAGWRQHLGWILRLEIFIKVAAIMVLTLKLSYYLCHN